jgi:hypothetical protein
LLAAIEEVAVYDEYGRVDGLQFDSKERRIQLWKEKKDDEAFDRLIAKLRQHKNYRSWFERRKDDQEFRERLRAHCRRMRVKHGDRRNAEARAKRKQQAVPIANTCQECEKVFTIDFGFKKKRTSKFCSRSCRNRHHHKTRVRKRPGPVAAAVQAERKDDQ